MSIRRFGRSWLLVLLLGLAVASFGCGSPSKTPEPDNSSAPNDSKNAPTETVSVNLAPGPKGGVLWLSEMVAEGIGAFKDQGINLSVLSTPGGNEATKALMDGQADFALLAFDHVLKNRAQGADLVVVSFLTKNPGLIMIVQNDLKDKVKSIKDLKGMKIGVSSMGGGTQMATLSLMAQAGMAPTDVEFVAAKDKLAEMWDSKQISAAMHVDPQITDLVGANKAWILYDLRKDTDTKNLYGTEYPLGTLVTRSDVIEKKPDLVQKMVNALMASNKYIQGHSAAEVSAAVPADYKGGSKYYDLMVPPNVEGLTFSGTVSDQAMNTVLKQLKDNKVVPADAKVDIATSVNLNFVNKAAKP